MMGMAISSSQSSEERQLAPEVSRLFDLTGKTAIITGGGRGIGKAIAEALTAAGAKVVITGRREEWLKPTTDELQSKGCECIPVIADVSKPEDIERTVKTAVDSLGHVDILFNNAGQTWGQPTIDLSLEKWQQIINVNLTGSFLMSQAVGRHMLERKSGRIINVASVAGLGAQGSNVVATIAYNASKAALISFTKNLAQEWGRQGILVNAIAPGWFPTRMASGLIEKHRQAFEERTALGRLGDLEELKGVAIFLSAEASRYITGQTIVVDGGISL
jgi:NAD(P)-dependent dehydrogenase (short-subunit alcohol dehydrogenase family)